MSFQRAKSPRRRWLFPVPVGPYSKRRLNAGQDFTNASATTRSRQFSVPATYWRKGWLAEGLDPFALQPVRSSGIENMPATNRDSVALILTRWSEVYRRRPQRTKSLVATRTGPLGRVPGMCCLCCKIRPGQPGTLSRNAPIIAFLPIVSEVQLLI